MAIGLFVESATASIGLAQETQATTADPAEIRRRIEDRTIPRPADEPGIEIAPGTVSKPAGDRAGRFTLSAVVVNGATAFDADAFGSLYEDYLARPVTSADVEAILDRITTKYRDAGYFLSRAVAAPQDVSAGILRVDVVEGYIESVAIDGDAPDPERISAYAGRVLELRPLTLERFERTLILINDLAGISIGANLDPIDGADGAYELTLQVEHDAVDATVYMDNRGTREVGRFQTWLSAGMNAQLGLGERVQIGLFTVPNNPRELVYLDVNYEQPIDRNGTYFSVQVARSDSDAGGVLSQFDAESHSTSATISVWHPIIRSRKENLWLVGSIGFLRSGERRQGAVLFEDRTRIARLTTTYFRADSLDGTTGFSFTVSKGLGIFGASPHGAAKLSRFDGRSDFTKFTAEISRDQSLVHDFAVAASVRGQRSTVPLLSSEEFGVGGIRYGRAYDSSEITGDDGAAASLELRFDKDLEGSFLTNFQIYGFYDIGAIWNKQPGGKSRRASLASAGGGVRLNMDDSFFATFEIAQPLTRMVANEGDDDARAFFSVGAQF